MIPSPGLFALVLWFPTDLPASPPSSGRMLAGGVIGVEKHVFVRLGVRSERWGRLSGVVGRSKVPRDRCFLSASTCVEVGSTCAGFVVAAANGVSLPAWPLAGHLCV